MLSKKYEHGRLYEKYDMTGDIHIGTGIVRVHDIFNPLPSFMGAADVIFCDPPYNASALNGYYTKAEIEKKPESFRSFFEVLFKRIAQINPRILILEVGVPQLGEYLDEITSKYKHVIVKDSMYYGNAKNRCKIIIASNDEIPECLSDMSFMDEEKVIEYICQNLEYSCIGDLCMGTGLVGFYSDKYGKPFVGTELNKKRLAVLLERITTKSRGTIK